MKKLLGVLGLSLIAIKVINDRMKHDEFDDKMADNIERNKQIMRERFKGFRQKQKES
jgi:hypothetical protein